MNVEEALRRSESSTGCSPTPPGRHLAAHPAAYKISQPERARSPCRPTPLRGSHLFRIHPESASSPSTSPRTAPTVSSPLTSRAFRRRRRQARSPRLRHSPLRQAPSASKPISRPSPTSPRSGRPSARPSSAS
jgi:hypothetical protein